MEKLYTRKEAAEYLGVSIKTLDEARKAGEIAFIQYTDYGRIHFTETALQEFIARCAHSQTGQSNPGDLPPTKEMNLVRNTGGSNNAKEKSHTQVWYSYYER